MKSSYTSAATSVLVAACFFLSGATSLVYEVVWTRLLTLVFGCSTFAVSTVLAAFMAGLALGSVVFGRAIDRWRRPLRFYAWLEVGIGCCALALPLLLHGLEPVYQWVWARFAPSFYVFSVLRFLLAFSLLVVPTTCMGATLPVLAKFMGRRRERLGRSVGMLYAVNTLGAVAGTLAAGFLLIPGVGVRRTLAAAAAVNFALGLVLLLHARWVQRGADSDAPDEVTGREVAAPPALPRGLNTVVLTCFAVSGAVAMLYEVAWTRVLSLTLGPSVYAFALMLATFLFGLTAGSAVFSLIVDRLHRQGLALLLWLQVAIAAASFGTVLCFAKLPYWFTLLFFHIDPSSTAMFGVQLLLCAAVMLLPAFLLGGVFPVVVRLCVGSTGRLGKAVGNVYAVNTVGAIAGSLLAGFVLIPTVGIQPTILVGLTVNLALVALLVVATRPFARASTVGSLAVLALAATNAWLWQPRWNDLLMSSGMYHYADELHDLSPKAFRDFTVDSYDELFYEEGLVTTVTVAKEKGDTNLWLATNGKIDASSESDLPTQVLCAHLPLLLHGRAHDVLVIGWASGVTVGSAALYPDTDVTGVEIEPAILEASALFNEVNHRPLDNPRVTPVLADARNYLLVTQQRFDVLISEPSNPWISGTSNLFTREAFQLARNRLRPGGVFCQWLQLYGLQPPHLKALLRTFHDVFPHVLVFCTLEEADLALLGSTTPFALDLHRVQELLNDQALRDDLSRIDIRDTYDLLSTFRLGTAQVEALVGSGPLNTDDNALIEYAAPRTLFDNTRQANVQELARFQSSPAELVASWDGTPVEKRDFLLTLAGVCRRNNQLAVADHVLADVLTQFPELTPRRALKLADERAAAARPADDQALDYWGE